MKLAPFIAWRYLFARKSHNVINVISGISALGMAVGTAALVLILSVYNGFDGIIRSNLSDADPDLSVCRSDGRRFVPEGPVFESVFDDTRLSSVGCSLSEDVFIVHEGRQAVAKARGVDFVFEEESGMAKHVVLGDWALHLGDLPLAALGTGLANKLGASPRWKTPLSLYYPSGAAAFSASNPMASLSREQLLVGSILSINADEDEGLLILPIETLSSLLGCTREEVSAVELRFSEGLSARECRRFARELRRQLGPDFEVRDRYMQHEALYKMMRAEKAAIWLILAFVVLIIALNIFGSLSMLIIEKKEDIATLKAMGAPDSLIRRVFVLEGWLVSLLGMAVGLLIGVLLAWLQQRFGFVKMPGTFIVDAYPVVLKWSDVLLTAASVALIGLLVALSPARRHA
ncbi:MAG: FtsX-like permease family protein [Bacteroidales bacterium]|nr:FtsX-like permease family protein [Bacteroidales bacterium]